MARKPLDPDLRRIVEAALDNIEDAHREQAARQKMRNEAIRRSPGTLGKLARVFGLSRSHVARIKNGVPAEPADSALDDVKNCRPSEHL